MMKFGWLLVFALGVAVPKPVLAQVTAYGEFSASKLTGGLTTHTTNVIYGPTIGLTAQIAALKNVYLSGDVRAGFYDGSAKLDQVALGPKIAIGVRKFEAYAEILVGFARYSSNVASASTDAQTELNLGLDLRGSKSFDWRIIEYGYEQYYGLGGEFNPKTFSTGLVFHLGKR